MHLNPALFTLRLLVMLFAFASFQPEFSFGSQRSNSQVKNTIKKKPIQPAEGHFIFTEEMCIEQIKKENNLIDLLSVIEFQNLTNPDAQYLEYLNLYKNLKNNFRKFKGITFEELNSSEKHEYILLLKHLAACSAKLASTGGICAALGFARKSKEYGEEYLLRSSDDAIRLILGSLYLNVPVYPFSFGSIESAEMHFDGYQKSCKASSSTFLNFIFHERYSEFLQNQNKPKEAQSIILEGLKIKPKNCVEFIRKKIFEEYAKSFNYK